MIDMHFHVTVRRAVHIVGAKHTALDGGTQFGMVLLFCLADVEQHVAGGAVAVAADIGVCRTAEHVAFDGAAKHVGADIAIHTTGQIIGAPQFAT